MTTIAVVTRVRDEINLLPWHMANMGYADGIYLCDGGSVDGTWEAIRELANRDRRVRASQWPDHGGWYAEQGEHLRYAFSQLERHYDWVQYNDIDDIPSLAFQKGIGAYLSQFTGAKIGMTYDELYLASGWTEYYEEVSRYPVSYIWNYVPKVTGTDAGRPLFSIEEPRLKVPLPKEMCLMHWNWALEERFKVKMERYLGSPAAHGQTVSWHPDEKFKDRVRLPDYARWHAPDGSEIGPGEMTRWFPPKPI